MEMSRAKLRATPTEKYISGFMMKMRRAAAAVSPQQPMANTPMALFECVLRQQDVRVLSPHLGQHKTLAHANVINATAEFNLHRRLLVFSLSLLGLLAFLALINELLPAVIINFLTALHWEWVQHRAVRIKADARGQD
jgi:hypothetical protein